MISARKKGFTLIELLVVIAIIAILAAILFPVFAQARRSALVSQCISNLKQCGTAIMLYTDDYKGRYPAAGALKSARHYAVDGGSTWWAEAVKKYMANDEKILLCPVARADPAYKTVIKANGSTYFYYCGHHFPTLQKYPDAQLCGYAESDVSAPSQKPLLTEAYGSMHPSDGNTYQYPFFYCDGHVKAERYGNWEKELVPACYRGRDGALPAH